MLNGRPPPAREQGAQERDGGTGQLSDHFAQHTVELLGHLFGRLEAIVRFGGRTLEQESMQRVVPLEQRHRLAGRGSANL